MILEEKIIRVIILASIFFGLFNLIGQFGGFLTPFIFNYTLVSLVAIFFSIRNYGKDGFWTLIAFTISLVGITLSSAQLLYLINLFGSGKIEWEVNPQIHLSFHFLLWFSLAILILTHLRRNRIYPKARNLLLLELTLLGVYALAIFLEWQISVYLFLVFSFTVAANLLINEFRMTPGFIRIALLLFLNASLEGLKIISILFV